jgi:hypothetical protein
LVLLQLFPRHLSALDGLNLGGSHRLVGQLLTMCGYLCTRLLAALSLLDPDAGLELLLETQ